MRIRPSRWLLALLLATTALTTLDPLLNSAYADRRRPSIPTTFVDTPIRPPSLVVATPFQAPPLLMVSAGGIGVSCDGVFVGSPSTTVLVGGSSFASSTVSGR